MNRNLLLLLLLSLIISCSKENGDAVHSINYSYQYFPTDSGIIRYYQADSIFWDANNQAALDTVSYEIKEVIAGNFFDNQNQPCQRVERYRKDNNGHWIIWKVLSDKKTLFNAERYIDNIRFVKLKFPLAVNEKWNGNALNTSDAQYYQITQLHQPDQINSLSFDSVCVVLQDDYIDATRQFYGLEKYAANVGMIYRREKNIATIPTSQGVIIKGGYDYTEKLLSYTLHP
ncbi:MAG: hypothetical protein ACKOX3_07055 [Bacteroidota bacterium]